MKSSGGKTVAKSLESMISGAKYWGVPQKVVVVSSVPISLANPKSAIFTYPHTSS